MSEFAHYRRLAETHGDALVILAFPSGDFWQEKSTNEQIIKYAESERFPGVMLEKSSVRGGSSAMAAWRYLLIKSGVSTPLWNFRAKIIVDKVGVCRQAGDVDREIAAEVAALIAYRETGVGANDIYRL